MAKRDLAGHYFSLGTQYYVAARAATIAGLLPVPGNLFHHAVEMFFKGDLSQELSASALKALGHRLTRIWAAFKKKHNDRTLSSFDLRIRALDKFELIRYPDAIAARGMYATISVGPFTPTIESASGRTPPGFHLVVQELDHLVGTIFHKASMNPTFFFGRLSAEAREALFANNPAFSDTKA